MNVLAIVVGALVIASAVTDASSTLVTTRRGNRRFAASQVFYRTVWQVWQALSRRVESPQTRQLVLSSFGPLSLLMLLVTWVTVIVVGWGLVWWGLRGRVDEIDSLIDAIYFSGVTFFTLGYGDVVPTGPLARVLAVSEAFLGLGLVALVIGFLPVLYGAYSRREVQLLTLDDLTERVTPVGLIESCYRQGGLEKLYAMFGSWDRWCADVFDSHTAYPMLMLFRSRQPGQSWLTALGVVTDAAAQTIAVVPDAATREPAFLYRRAVRTLEALSVVRRQHRPVVTDLPLANEAEFRDDYERLVTAGLPARPFRDAWGDIQDLRAPYRRLLRAFMAVLLIEPVFRTHAPAIPGPTQARDGREGE